MKAEIKSSNIFGLHDFRERSVNPALEDLEDWVPADPEVFTFGLQLIVGAEGAEGEDSFDINVVTPKWLLFNSEEKIFIGRHYLIMLSFNFERLRNYIASYIETCTGDTWLEVAEKLGRLGKWEFEDYRE